MNLKSKVFSLLLVCIMVFSALSLTAFGEFSDVNSENQYYEAITNLSGMEVINGYPDGTFLPENEVTRAEMAKMIAVLFQLGATTVTDMPFSDVPVDHWAATFITVARNRGIINGMGDGTFQPDGKVTYHQAVTMIIRALSYEVVAQEKGGWEGGGYITTAQQINLLKKASAPIDDNALRGLIAQLLFNSTYVTPLVYDVSSGTWKQGTAVDRAGNQIRLSNVLIVGVPNIFFDSRISVCQDDEICALVNNEIVKFKVGSFANAANYIGQNVNLNYEEDENTHHYVIKSIVAANANQTTEIKLSDVKAISDAQIEYYITADRSRTAKISFTGTRNVIYNERIANPSAAYTRLLSDVANSDALNSEGTVKVTVGNDTVINIKSYKSYFVSTAVSSSNGLYTITADTPDSMPSVVFEVDTKADHIYKVVVKKATLGGADKDGYTTATWADNNVSALASLRNSVISVAQSIDTAKGSYIEFILGPNTLTNSTITEHTEEYEYKIVKISNKNYKVAQGMAKYPDAYSQIKTEASGTYYTDAFGQIVWIGTLSSGNYRAGILLNISAPTDKNVDDRYTAKFYDLKAGSTFNVLLEATVVDDLFKGKPETFDKLYVMKLSNNTVRDTGNIKCITSAAGDSLSGNNTVYKVISDISLPTVTGTTKDADVNFRLDGSKYQFGYKDSSDKFISSGTSISLSAVTVYERSDVTIAREARTLKKSSLMTEFDKYSGVIYQIAEPSGSSSSATTANYVLYNPIKSITASSEFWVVSKNSNSIDITEAISIDVIKFGSPSTNKTIKIHKDAASQLNLKVGDVFAFYNNSETAGIDIDKKDAVTVLLRADAALKENALGSSALRYVLNSDESENTDKYSGFDFMGIYKASFTNGLKSGWWAYTLNLPVLYDTSNDNSHILYVGMKTSATTAIPLLPKNTLKSAFDGSDNSVLVSDSIESTSAVLNNVIVYNASETNENNRLTFTDNKESTIAVFDNLNTVRQCIDKGLELTQADLVFTYSHTDGGTTARYIYVLKR